MRQTIVVLLALVVGLLGFIAYQLANPPMERMIEGSSGVDIPDTRSGWAHIRQQRALSTLKTGLRNLATAQALHEDDNGRIADMVSALRAFRVSPEVRVRIIHADRHGWSARAYHRSIATLDCVIYEGTVPKIPHPLPSGPPAPRAGSPVCDE